MHAGRTAGSNRSIGWRLGCAVLLGATLGLTTGEAPLARAGDSAPTESLAAVDAEWKLVEKPGLVEYRRFLDRYRKISGADDRAREFARELLSRFDPNDRTAHETLGRREFTLAVPEEISAQRYPFVRIVREAAALRWLPDAITYTAAIHAHARCVAHAKRLATDPSYAALESARVGIDLDESLHAYNYDVLFASPYLICYSGKDRIDEAAMWRMPADDRARAFAELDKRRAGYKRVLAERGRVYAQVYRAFLKRFGERCGLKPLLDPYGGRPDLPEGRRSFRDGCPLVVWVFADREAWNGHHDGVRRETVSASVLGYHFRSDGRVYVFDRTSGEREDELLVNTAAATLQLLDWFSRQRSEWGRTMRRKTYFSSGISDWFGGVTMARDRTLTFGATNRTCLVGLRTTKAFVESKGKRLPAYPLRDLTKFRDAGDAIPWAAKNWGIGPGPAETVFRLQSWALVQYLNEAPGPKRRAEFETLVDLMLDRPKDDDDEHPQQVTAFAKAFALASDDDWKALEDGFAVWYAALATRDPATIGPKPPALDDWPGYVAPDLESPTGPAVAK